MTARSTSPLTITLAQTQAQLEEALAVIASLREQVKALEEASTVIAGLREQVKALEEEIERLRRAGKRQAAPFSRNAPSPNPKKPGRKKGQGPFSYRQSVPEEAVNRTFVSPLDACPDCGGELSELQSHEHTQTELPPPVPVVTRFVSCSGYCSHCRKRVRSRHSEQPSTAAGAASHTLGPRLLSVAADIKHRLGVPYAKVVEVMKVAHGVKVTSGGLCQANARLARKAEPVYEEIRQTLEQSPAVHMDETGWREGGKPRWLWVATNPVATLYAMTASRGHEVILKLLGENYAGILHSDFFSAYDHRSLADWLKQKCLSHIQHELSSLIEAKHADFDRQHVMQGGVTQDIHGLTIKSSQPAELLEDFHWLFRESLFLPKARPHLSAELLERRACELEGRLDYLLEKSDGYEDKDVQRLSKRMRKQREHLLRFLRHPEAEGTNNRAERALRPAVIVRKTGGCNKTSPGARTHAILMSVAVTARQQQRDIVEFFNLLLTSPLAQPPRLISLPETVPR